MQVRRLLPLPSTPFPIVGDQTSLQAEPKTASQSLDQITEETKVVPRRRASSRVPVTRPGPIGPVVR